MMDAKTVVQRLTNNEAVFNQFGISDVGYFYVIFVCI